MAFPRTVAMGYGGKFHIYALCTGCRRPVFVLIGQSVYHTEYNIFSVIHGRRWYEERVEKYL